ncbi:hypothetical protein V6N13_063843 [Hibiscus sabdariffa]
MDTAVVDVWKSELRKLSNRKFTHHLTASQVRHARISECSVETRMMAKHQHDAFDPAFEPGMPHLICTRGEDRLVQHDMGQGHNPVPFSSSSSCSEANGKGTPQIYKGHRKKETVDSKKGGELVGAKKEHVLEVDCIEPHPHNTVLASSGFDGIKIWTPNAIDKGKLATTKIEQDKLVSVDN